MNTFSVERSTAGGKDYLSIGGQRIAAEELRLPWVPKLPAFVMGIRPKNVVLGAAGRPGSVNGRIHTFEVLGDFTLASVELESGDLIFKIGEAGLRLALDEPVSISFEPEKVLYYDPQSTLRIRPGR